MTETPLLTLDTLAKYLRDKEVQLDIEDNAGQHFIRMGWQFEMGDAAVLISVNDGPSNTSRLEVTCVTQKTYADRREEVVALLNDRNRERAFSRSIDAEGNVWLEYIGLYPTLVEMPQDTFDTLFGGVLMHFQEDYASLEGITPHLQA
ncbi:YbjN domain-containing protein [Deinococcus hopiensis]|uniref:Putative sensory transduction regulator n=1 Tax=Deinococcus hopiensis KR-140 TaxID=695939 RepID=A0A1W1VS78_9DEIO|nr:YbjN domain-containing protein [Deinococcus hopiensis]SMB96133.1 Putative sensory transduction regulator [Deinococcus hopiensis KR-140]